MHLQTRKARPGVETRTGWPLSTAGCHRPDGDCHHDDVGRDGVHRGCEADDDDRHQPARVADDDDRHQPHVQADHFSDS